MFLEWEPSTSTTFYKALLHQYFWKEGWPVQLFKIDVIPDTTASRETDQAPPTSTPKQDGSPRQCELQHTNIIQPLSTKISMHATVVGDYKPCLFKACNCWRITRTTKKHTLNFMFHPSIIPNKLEFSKWKHLYVQKIAVCFYIYMGRSPVISFGWR